MRLWILSDVHLELDPKWDLPNPLERPNFDVLIVAGDLVPRMERGVRWLADRIETQPVLYVAGNHEGYRTDIDRTLEKARAAAAASNVVVMENDTAVIDGVRFIGATMWTDFRLMGAPQAAMDIAADQMNDYRLIRREHYSRRLRPIDTLRRHEVTRAFIEDELSRPFAGPSVVITHHAPYPAAVAFGDAYDPLSAAYASDLTALIERRTPAVWIFGHLHHHSARTNIGSTRVVSNPKGYPARGLSRWDNPEFDPKFTIDV